MKTPALAGVFVIAAAHVGVERGHARELRVDVVAGHEYGTEANTARSVVERGEQDREPDAPELGERLRVQHYDNAQNHGAAAGKVMDGGRLRWVDEGLPIAYQVLDEGVPVYASDGEQVGTVDHVVSAPSEHIFHGIVMSAGGGRRFVAADQVASLREHGVDLRIDTAAAAALPEPHGGAAAWRDRDPGVKPSRWTHILDLMSGADPRRRDWTEED